MAIKQTKRLILVEVLLIIGIAVICFHLNRTPSGPPRQIVLISIDTTRADYLSCYGYPRKTTPNIDELAADGVLFEHTVATVPITLPSHSTMLTGTIPPYHRVHDNLDYRLAEDNTTLAEIFKTAGYKTAGFVSTFVLDPQFGIAQGFDDYDADCEEDAGEDLFAERRAEETTKLAIDWLKKNAEDKFFLFVHYYDPHIPLTPPEPFKSQFGSTNPKDLYAAEIAYTDHHIGKLIDSIKSLGLYDDTLIIFAGDHGESLGEHRESEHGYFIYDCTVRVPMIIKPPGNTIAKRVNNITGLVDIVPTACAISKLQTPGGVSGQDLTPYLFGESAEIPKRYLYSESLLACNIQCNPLQSLSTDGWKYIRTTREELYDLKNDPGELHNLAGTDPKRARMMRKRLETVLAEHTRKSGSESTMVLDEQTRKRLAALGYVGGGVSPDIAMAFDYDKRDPKDYIDYFVLKSDVEQHIMAARLENAKEGIESLLVRYPQMAQTHFLCGQYALRTGDTEGALKAFKRNLELNPDDWRGYMGAGRASLNLKKFEDAIALLQNTLRLKSDNIDARRLLAMAYNKINQFSKAADHLKQIVDVNPDDSLAQHELATAYVGLGDMSAAVKHWKEALRIRPDWPEVLNNVAWLLATQPKAPYANAAKALELAKKACELTDHAQAGCLDTLAVSYAANGKYPEAITTADKARELAEKEGQTDFAQRIHKRQELYRLNKPYYE